MTTGTCCWCGAPDHGGVWCPRVKAVEYHADGMVVKRVELFEPVATPDATPVESDDAYRARLILRGAATVWAADIATATGSGLDKIGSYYDMKRHGT